MVPSRGLGSFLPNILMIETLRYFIYVKKCFHLENLLRASLEIPITYWHSRILENSWECEICYCNRIIKNGST